MLYYGLRLFCFQLSLSFNLLFNLFFLLLFFRFCLLSWSSFKSWNIIFLFCNGLFIFLGYPEWIRFLFLYGVHDEVIYFFNIEMGFPIDHFLPLQSNQVFSFCSIFHNKISLSISSIILQIKNNIFDPINFLWICFVDWFRGRFKWHVREVNSQLFAIRIGRKGLHIFGYFFHIFNFPWRILFLMIILIIIGLVLIIVISSCIVGIYAPFRRCQLCIFWFEIRLPITIIIVPILISPSSISINFEYKFAVFYCECLSVRR